MVAHAVVAHAAVVQLSGAIIGCSSHMAACRFAKQAAWKGRIGRRKQGGGKQGGSRWVCLGWRAWRVWCLVQSACL